MKVARQALLEFGRREKVVNRQIRQRVAGEKVTRGPGRPRRQDRAKVGVSHAARAELGVATAVHVTVKTTACVPNLRTRRRFAVIRNAFARFCVVDEGFRLVRFAVLKNQAV